MEEKTKKNQKSTLKKKSFKGSVKSLINYLELPKEWHKNFDEKEVFCSKLSQTSEQYVLVYNKITSTLDCNITSIKRIENPFLLGCYLLKKKEYKAKGIKVKELEIFHCTNEKNASNIVKNNFDWRKTVRGKFGWGVSFSRSARYADRHANSSIGTKRAMIMVKVLIGRVLNADCAFKIPPRGFDTTSGNGNMIFRFVTSYRRESLITSLVCCKHHDAVLSLILDPYSGELHLNYENLVKFTLLSQNL